MMDNTLPASSRGVLPTWEVPKVVFAATSTPPLVTDLALVLAIAAAIVLLFHKLGVSLVVAYLLAGILLRQFTPSLDLLRDAETINAIAELGVILLIFTIGLEFNLRRLRRLGLRILLIGTIEILLMFGAGYWAGVFLGWTTLEAIYLGGIFSIASTTVITKSLMESGKLQSEEGQLVLGILVIEDLAVVILLTLLSGLSTTGSVAPLELLSILGRMALFTFVAIALGLLVVPSLVDTVAKLKVRELLLMTVLGLCFGMAMLALFLGLTSAVGAFVMGVLVAEARRNTDVLRAIGPLRDLFVALFFVAMGLLVDLEAIVAYLPLALLLVGVFVVLKATVLSGTSALFGTEGRTAIAVGLSMVALGEFSLLLARLGLDLGVTRSFLFPLTAALVLITAVLAPYSIRASGRLSQRLFERLPLRMREYGLLLSRWTASMSQALRRGTPATKAMREDVQGFLVDVAIIGVLGAPAWAVFLFQAELSSLLQVEPDLLVLAAGFTFALASVQPFLHLLRRLGHLLRVTTGAMVAASPSAKIVGFPTLYRVLLLILGAVTLVVGGVTLSVLLGGLLALSPLSLLLVFGVAGGAGALLWGALRILHERMRVALTPRGDGSETEEEERAE